MGQFGMTGLRLFCYFAISLSSHPAIQLSSYPAIQPSSYPAIQLSSYPAIQLSSYPAIQPSSHPAIPPSRLVFGLRNELVCPAIEKPWAPLFFIDLWQPWLHFLREFRLELMPNMTKEMQQ